MKVPQKPARQKITPPVGAPWVPPDWTIEEAGALQAQARGEAEPHQQKIVLDFIINKLSATYDISYRPDGLGGDRDTAFAEGKRFIGQQLVKLIKINLSKHKRTTDGGEPSEQP